MLGVIGFIGGFVGPIVFTPEANQGPLLGIFITGPLGFVLGLIVGLVLSLQPRRY
ncbi:multidrug ABC transporter permease [Mesorhizobium sp. LNHC252B00]|nr:multidrug ABC transporter permease [Mesorhizobium sp. LNHC252B00]